MLAVTVRSCIEELQPVPGKGEIVIVDNSDKDKFKTINSIIPSGYVRDKTVRIFRQEYPCLFTARETAVKEAKGEYVLCIDSHMLTGHNMTRDLVDFMDRRSDDPSLGFAHAPVNWAHQHEDRAKHDRDMSVDELGNWGGKVKTERRITWKGMPWICRRDWFLNTLGGYGALAEHKMAWGGGDMHLGIKTWLLGYENWGVPCRPGIHIGPFPKLDGKTIDVYRLYGDSGNGVACVGFLVSCYILGGEAMMVRNEKTLAKRFTHMNPRDHWKEAINLGRKEKEWLDKRRVLSFRYLLEGKPWNSSLLESGIVQRGRPKPPKQRVTTAKALVELKPRLKCKPSLGLMPPAGGVSKCSVILAYQHLPERLSLFKACLNSLLRASKGRVEICVHEVGSSKVLGPNKGYKYLFTEHKGIFHRAWALNRGAVKLATGNMLLLMDADLIVNSAWISEILGCNKLAYAWGKLHYLSKKGTKNFLKEGITDKSLVKKTKVPSMGCAAGAAILIPRDLFSSVEGIPEDFAGSWGGEDNTFLAKLITMGHRAVRFKSELFHLYHEPTTPRVSKIQRKAAPMIKWNKAQWNRHTKAVKGSWGKESSDSYKMPSVEYIAAKDGPRLTFAMLSWLRYDKLLNTLKVLKETLTIPANMVVMVQGSERLDAAKRKAIRRAANKFVCGDVFFSEGNIGTGPARKALLERTLNRFHSPYINLADDDTTYTEGSIEAVLKLLDEDQSLGMAGIRYKERVYRLDSTIKPTMLTPKVAKVPVEYVDSTGSASAFIRREVFNHCSIDPTYKIGQWDLDLCLQIRSVGWRIANYRAFKNMKAINDWGGCREYKKARLNMKKIRRSVTHMKSKWKLKRVP